MSSREMTCTGSAVSASMRLMDDPVISTRSSCCGCACAQTMVGLRANRLPTAGTRSAAICLALSFIMTPQTLCVGEARLRARHLGHVAVLANLHGVHRCCHSIRAAETGLKHFSDRPLRISHGRLALFGVDHVHR